MAPLPKNSGSTKNVLLVNSQFTKVPLAPCHACTALWPPNSLNEQSAPATHSMSSSVNQEGCRTHWDIAHVPAVRLDCAFGGSHFAFLFGYEKISMKIASLNKSRIVLSDST